MGPHARVSMISAGSSRYGLAPLVQVRDGMDFTRLTHDPMTCRWGRRPVRQAGQAPPAGAGATWLCCRPEQAAGRVVGAADCAACEQWEPGMLPPCPAIGWA